MMTQSFCVNTHSICVDRIIFENKNFLLVIGFGLISSGHVMVVTKRHFDCMAELPGTLVKEYEDLKKQVYKIIKEKYNS